MSHGKTAQQITYAIAAALDEPSRSVVYLCPSLERARLALWYQFMGALGDRDCQYNRMHYRIDFPNGSAIRLIREDEERRGHGLMIDKITGEPAGAFWRSRLRS